MMTTGFAFHSSKKLQALAQAVVSSLVFFVIIVLIATENRPYGDLLKEKPAWFFAAGVFFIFMSAAELHLIHILKTKYILEFSESGLVDRRKQFTPRVIPYDAIEIFSPEPERLVGQDPRMKDYIAVSARLRDQHPAAAAGDFVFFEKVAPLSAEAREILPKLLRAALEQGKIAQFARLVEDEGDDMDEFDRTNA